MRGLSRRRFLGWTGRVAALSSGALLSGRLPAAGAGREVPPLGRLAPREGLRRPELISGTVTGKRLQYPMQTTNGLPPAQVAALESAKRSNLFTRGADQVVLRASNAHGGALVHPSAYEVLDIYGRLLRVGTVAGPTISLGPASDWPLGWFRLRLVGARVDPIFGNAYGAATFAVIDPSPDFPPVPAWGTPGSAIDVLGDGQDFVMRGLLDTGCARLSIQDAANPEQEARGFLRNVQFDRSWWLDPAYADPVRPHAHFVSFPNGTSSAAQLAGVTRAVQTMYPAVQWFEGPSNEPDNSIPPQQTATRLQAFARAVKEGNPAAKVLGPCLVTVNQSATAYWSSLLATGAGRVLDGVSTHLYNCVNGDPWLGDATMGPWDALLRRHGVGHLPRWNTETGDLLTDYGSYHPRRQLRWSIVRLLEQERWGIPKERSYYFYDASHGFWGFPSWLEGQQPGQAAADLQPIAVAMRALSLALRGTTFAEQLDFGAAASQVLRGYVFRGAARTTVALFTAGTVQLSVRLGVSATSASGRDVFGNAVPATPADGVVDLSIGELPVYLELPGGAAVRPLEVGDGLLAPGPNLARRARPATNGSPTGLSKVNAGRQFSSYLENNDLGGPGSPWYDSTGTFPALLSLTWPSTRTVRRAVIFFSPPWHQNSAPVRFAFQVLAADGSTWQTHYAYANQTATSAPFADIITGCTRETFYDEQWVFNIVLPSPVRTRAVRIDVAATTFGGDPDVGTYELCSQNQGGPRRLCVRDFAVYAE